MEYINLTPHSINVRKVDGSSVIVPASGTICRVSVTMQPSFVEDGIQVYAPVYGDIQNLPLPEEGKVFIVSRMIKDRCPDRADVRVPGNLIRDEQGNVIGAEGLSL